VRELQGLLSCEGDFPELEELLEDKADCAKSWKLQRQRIVIRVRMEPILRKLLEAGKDDCARLCASVVLLTVAVSEVTYSFFMSFSLWNSVWD
jgi:hypothetical protein